jgi:hypothetical protein
MTRRTFIIGDVHGCYDELRLLYATLDPKHNDRFAFVGDIGDKGPRSLSSYRFVKLLLNLYPGSVCVAGNHESKALERLRQGKLETKGEDWTREATAEDWAFIKSMPLYHRYPELNALILHAGVFPRFFDLYPEGLDDERILREGWQRKGGKYVGRARRFQYVRYINPDTGDMVTLGEESDDTPHWSTLYDGREGRIFYGHEPQRTFQPKVHEHSICLDTSCVTGGKMTAAVLREGTNEVEFVQIDCIRTYQEWKPQMYFYQSGDENNDH